MQESLQKNTAQLPLAIRSAEHTGFGASTNSAIIGGCDAAQIGAIIYATQLAKDMNHPIERIWLDGGNAKTLAAEIGKLSKLHLPPVEHIEGLVLRGIWAWLIKNQ